MTPQRLDEILAKVPALKIAVVGDVFLDKYYDIDRRLEETSVETGRQAHQVTNVRCYPGAGGSAAQKLAALGVGWVPAITVIGTTGEAFDLKLALQRDRIDTQHVIESPQRWTCTYMKPMLHEPGKSPLELDRLDIKNYQPLPHELENRVMTIVNQQIDRLDGAIVVDQVPERDCGIITSRVRQFLENMAVTKPSKVFFADSRYRIDRCRHMIVKPNCSELAEAVGLRSAAVASHQEIRLAGRKLMHLTGKPAIITMGADGLLVLEDTTDTLIPAYQVSGPIDICGAGDSVTAGTVTALCAGATLPEAALIGGLVASITIQQIGVTGTATPEQLRRRLAEYNEQQGIRAL
jgi:bifunctional ADP-heptose synthase (sugar kinase/adenylyltransferase)